MGGWVKTSVQDWPEDLLVAFAAETQLCPFAAGEYTRGPSRVLSGAAHAKNAQHEVCMSIVVKLSSGEDFNF